MKAKIICHGGVSNIPDKLEAKQKVVEHAAQVGMFALSQNHSAVDAVVEAITIMEDSPLCNAGTGSFIQMDGKVRMDACLMDQDLNVGAVVQVSEVKNPIQVARSIRQQGVHSIMGGQLASDFAHNAGHDFYDPRTEERILTWLEQWKRFRHADPQELIIALREAVRNEEMLGTVGAVAIDQNGKIAAGTSTGGLKLDLPGRVGDVPLVGCGTYCNHYAGISCTGTGEMIIKVVLAKAVAAALEHGLTLDEAMDLGMEQIAEVKGHAGFIVITEKGEVGHRFNTKYMAMAKLEA